MNDLIIYPLLCCLLRISQNFLLRSVYLLITFNAIHVVFCVVMFSIRKTDVVNQTQKKGRLCVASPTKKVQIKYMKTHLLVKRRFCINFTLELIIRSNQERIVTVLREMPGYDLQNNFPCLILE